MGTEEVGQNEGGRGWEQRKAARRDSPPGPWHEERLENIKDSNTFANLLF